MIQTAILGGGPAGAHCAYSLIEKGIYPTIFDHSHPREKPCGGLVSDFGQQLFPFLNKIPIEHRRTNKIHYISPHGNQKTLCVNYWFLSFSRMILDQYLINKAVEKGAKLIKEKVIAVQKKGNRWQLKTSQQNYTAKILIGADGVNSIVRREIIGPLKNKNRALCFGYLVKELEDADITIKFLPYRKGYIWVIPRKRNTSIGIAITKTSISQGLKEELDAFIKQNFPDVKKISSWGGTIPNIKNLKTYNTPLAGNNWILIGDAAGHANPITGEGIMYALLDGEMAAETVAENRLMEFNKKWRKTYGIRMAMAIKARNLVYNRYILELYFKSLRFHNFLRSNLIQYN